MRILLRLTALAALATGLAACAAGSPQNGPLPLPEIAAGTINEATMRDVTERLSSDEFEGRMPGTVGEDKTVELLIQRFAAAGLKPGNKGSWVQDVPLVDITAENTGPLQVKAKDGSSHSFAYGKEWIGTSFREANTIDLANSELVFVGYGIVAPEKGWNDYDGVDMRGKTAVILINDPDYANETLEGPFNGKAMTYYGRWTYKFEEAARQGAAAALIIHEDYPAAYGWSVVESSWSGPQGFAERANGGADQTLVNGWVQKAVAERLLGASGQSFSALSKAASQQGFKPVPLGTTVSTRFTNSIRRYQSRNVIAMLEGSKRPSEVVLHTAHWDHLGRCSPAPDGDDICNGAIDNATGTAALVALAEAHAKAGPAERSLVFLAVTAEESGLLGSEYYGANPVFPLAQTVGGVNLDALSMAGPARNVTVIGGGKSELDRYLEATLSALGRVATPDASPQAGYYYRSDHFSLAKRGVPMLYADGGNDLISGGVAAGEAFAARYNEIAYHGPKDEFDPKWDWTGVMQDLQLYYRFGRMLAETKDWPKWYEGDEFRRIRDESCAKAKAAC